MDDLNKIVSWIGKTKGVHYRPHRQNPKKYIVVKIYLKIGKLGPKKTRDILETYLASLSIPTEGSIVRGSVKWVAIVDRAKFEAKHKGKSKGTVSQKELLNALSKSKAATKVSGAVKAQQKQVQQQKKYTLNTQGTQVQGYAGKYSLDMPEGPSVKQKKKQYVYTLEGQGDTSVHRLVDEARVALGLPAELDHLRERRRAREYVGTDADIHETFHAIASKAAAQLKAAGLDVNLSNQHWTSEILLGTKGRGKDYWALNLTIGMPVVPKPTSSISVRLLPPLSRTSRPEPVMQFFDAAGSAMVSSVMRALGNKAKLGRPKSKETPGEGYWVQGEAVKGALANIEANKDAIAKAIATPIVRAFKSSMKSPDFKAVMESVDPLEEAPSLDALRKKKAAAEKGTKPWTKLDFDEYEYKGKKGKWRTSPSGDRLFIPDDGSGPLGISKGKRDALSGQSDMFRPKKKKRDAGGEAPAPKAKSKSKGKLAKVVHTGKDRREAEDAAEDAAMSSGKDHVVWKEKDGSFSVTPYDAEKAKTHEPHMVVSGVSGVRDSYATTRKGADKKFPFARQQKQEREKKKEAEKKEWNKHTSSLGLSSTIGPRARKPEIEDPKAFKAATSAIAKEGKWKGDSNGAGLVIKKSGDGYNVTHEGSDLSLGKARTKTLAKALGTMFGKLMGAVLKQDKVTSKDVPEDVKTVIKDSFRAHDDAAVGHQLALMKRAEAARAEGSPVTTPDKSPEEKSAELFAPTKRVETLTKLASEREWKGGDDGKGLTIAKSGKFYKLVLTKSGFGVATKFRNPVEAAAFGNMLQKVAPKGFFDTELPNIAELPPAARKAMRMSPQKRFPALHTVTQGATEAIQEEYGSYLDFRHLNKEEEKLFFSTKKAEAVAYAKAHGAFEREVMRAADKADEYYVVARIVDNGEWDILRTDGEWGRVSFRGFYEPRNVARW
jgi:hypothetical protein